MYYLRIPSSKVRLKEQNFGRICELLDELFEINGSYYGKEEGGFVYMVKAVEGHSSSLIIRQDEPITPPDYKVGDRVRWQDDVYPYAWHGTVKTVGKHGLLVEIDERFRRDHEKPGVCQWWPYNPDKLSRLEE